MKLLKKTRGRRRGGSSRSKAEYHWAILQRTSWLKYQNARRGPTSQVVSETNKRLSWITGPRNCRKTCRGFKVRISRSPRRCTRQRTQIGRTMVPQVAPRRITKTKSGVHSVCLGRQANAAMGRKSELATRMGCQPGHLGRCSWAAVSELKVFGWRTVSENNANGMNLKTAPRDRRLAIPSTGTETGTMNSQTDQSDQTRKNVSH